MTIALDTVQFFATATGARKHLAQCPHLVGASSAHPLHPGVELELCDWCSKEIFGLGRTYFNTDLDAALAAFKAPLENRRLIKDALRGVEHDQIWMPYSSSYVALGLAGRGVAWTGKTYVVPAPGFSIELPGFVGGSGTATGRGGDLPWGSTCGDCFTTRSRNGACGCE